MDYCTPESLKLILNDRDRGFTLYPTDFIERQSGRTTRMAEKILRKLGPNHKEKNYNNKSIVLIVHSKNMAEYIIDVVCQLSCIKDEPKDYEERRDIITKKLNILIADDVIHRRLDQHQEVALRDGDVYVDNAVSDCNAYLKVLIEMATELASRGIIILRNVTNTNGGTFSFCIRNDFIYYVAGFNEFYKESMPAVLGCIELSESVYNNEIEVQLQDYLVVYNIFKYMLSESYHMTVIDPLKVDYEKIAKGTLFVSTDFGKTYKLFIKDVSKYWVNHVGEKTIVVKGGEDSRGRLHEETILLAEHSYAQKFRVIDPSKHLHRKIEIDVDK